MGLAIPSDKALGQSLTESLSNTYRTNPTLRAARAQLRQVNENVPQALSNWRPEVTVTGAAGLAHDSIQEPVDTNVDREPVEARLSIVQPLYRGGRTVAGTERAENEVRSERSRLQSIEQSVLLDGVTAYMDVWRDQSVLQLNINNEQVLRRQLEASQDRFTVGEITRTDVAQSESRVATATANRIAAEGNLVASQATFERVVGLAPGELLQPPPAEGQPGDKETVIGLSLENDPRVLRSIFNERAAERGVREVLGELLPSVELQGDLLHFDETTSVDSESQSVEILAAVRIPLYQQGAVSSRVRAAKQFQSQRRLEVDEARRQAQEDGISAWEDLQTAEAQIVSFQAAVRANEIALEGVRQENAVGARTILDILDAEQELLDSQVGLVGAQRDALVAGFAVLNAIGRLTARDLGLPVDYYDPLDDYRDVRDRWFGLSAPASDDGN
jgi:TolC family type I secretion outer membrane protein